MEGGEITPQPSSHRSITVTPQSSCSFEDNADGNFTTRSKAGGNLTHWLEIEKHETLRELQQMVNRYNERFCLLKDTVSTVELLRLESLQLTAENLELEFLIEDEESAAGGGGDRTLTWCAICEVSGERGEEDRRRREN